MSELLVLYLSLATVGGIFGAILFLAEKRLGGDLGPEGRFVVGLFAGLLWPLLAVAAVGWSLWKFGCGFTQIFRAARPKRSRIPEEVSTSIFKNGEFVGVHGEFRVEGQRLYGALAAKPGQWLALYRPASRIVRAWRWLRAFGRPRDGYEQQEIGFARAMGVGLDYAVVLDRTDWSPEFRYEGPMWIYLSREVTGDLLALPRWNQ